jgi:hypothetical protein
MDNAQRAVMRDVRNYLHRSTRHRSECTDQIVTLALRELRPSAVRSNGGWAVGDQEIKRLWTLIEQGHPHWLTEPPKSVTPAHGDGPEFSNEMGSVQWSRDSFNSKSARERMALSDRYLIEFDEEKGAFIGHVRH